MSNRECAAKRTKNWMFQASPFVQSERVTLQDESQEVEELQLAVLHVLLDVVAHQGPEEKRSKKSHTHAHTQARTLSPSLPRLNGWLLCNHGAQTLICATVKDNKKMLQWGREKRGPAAGRCHRRRFRWQRFNVDGGVNCTAACGAQRIIDIITADRSWIVKTGL